MTWLKDRPGVHFGTHGIILSDGALPADDSGVCSIEMWVRPAGGEDSGTLLAFYGPGGATGVSLQRSMTDLRLDRETGGGRSIRSYVGDLLPNGRRVFVTLVFSAAGTAAYVDGVLVRRLSRPRAAAGDCSGSFGVGHPAQGHTSWQGDIHGLAIYRQELTPEAVQASYRAWRRGRPPDGRWKPQALYLFNEKSGNVVRDHGSAGVNLRIPDQYQNIQLTWLQSPFGAFEGHWGYYQDIVINLGGFAPFGFALSAFLASLGRVRRVGLWTVAGGLVVSLTIELLQVYLPTRNSDLTDVLTNTLGTCLGLLIYRLWHQRMAAKCPADGGSI